jgi:ATP-dependent exoDNAse (exonuclease V) beta subunit
VVILQGLSATRWPDLRGEPAEEANIFHVAVTRAREQVHFVCPCAIRAVNGAGELVDEWVGPSPYLQQVAHLREAFIERVELSPGLADVTREAVPGLLATGLAIHEQSREELEQERYGRLQMLRLEAGLATPKDLARKSPRHTQDAQRNQKPESSPKVRRFLELILASQNAAATAPKTRPTAPLLTDASP